MEFMLQILMSAEGFYSAKRCSCCNTQRQQINPSLLRTIDAISHVRSTTDVGGGFLTSEHRLRPGKEGVPPLSNHGWPAHHPHETLSNQGKDYLRGPVTPPRPGEG